MTESGGASAEPVGWWGRQRTWQKVAWIVGGAFVVLVVLGGLFGEVPEDSNQPAAATTTSEPEATTTPPETSTPEATTTTTVAETTTTQVAATPVSTTTTTEAVPGIGDPVRDGQFEFVVTGTESPGKVYKPEGLLDDEAVGTWFIVFVTVENIGDREQGFAAGDQKILWQGREFSADDFTWNGTNFEDLNPGVVLEATVMFDVPEGFPESGEGTVLELHDSFLSGGVNVHL